MSNTGRPPAEGWVPAVTRLSSYGPYHRAEPIPLHWKAVTAQWLGSVLANRYPGLVVESMQTVELRNTHTTKLRVALAYNEKGRSAALPAQLCLKANFTGRATPLALCPLAPPFYHDLVEAP